MPGLARLTGAGSDTVTGKRVAGPVQGFGQMWEKTLGDLARSLGVEQLSVQTTKVCVERRRQWNYAGNVRHSPAVHMAVSTVTAPARWVRRRRTTTS